MYYDRPQYNQLEVQQLDNYFKSVTLPKGQFPLNEYICIVDANKFITSGIRQLKHERCANTAFKLLTLFKHLMTTYYDKSRSQNNGRTVGID